MAATLSVQPAGSHTGRLRGVRSGQRDLTLSLIGPEITRKTSPFMRGCEWKFSTGIMKL